MKRFASLVCATALFVVPTGRAGTPDPAASTFVFNLSVDREFMVGGEMPTNLTLQRGTSYRVHIETRSDDTARATFYDKMGRRVGRAIGAVEPRTAEAPNDIPASLDSTPRVFVTEVDGMPFLVIGDPKQRRVVIRLFAPGPEGMTTIPVHPPRQGP
jgi:hypothetical protein